MSYLGHGTVFLPQMLLKESSIGCLLKDTELEPNVDGRGALLDMVNHECCDNAGEPGSAGASRPEWTLGYHQYTSLFSFGASALSSIKHSCPIGVQPEWVGCEHSCLAFSWREMAPLAAAATGSPGAMCCNVVLEIPGQLLPLGPLRPSVTPSKGARNLQRLQSFKNPLKWKILMELDLGHVETFCFVFIFKNKFSWHGYHLFISFIYPVWIIQGLCLGA